ncbi:unnamed protein product [Phytophthora lilii]|uniref:Unnamed protein product n=1 Tax=Phytophthora lilii TaxID=2077276 RepID=A0A9W6WHE2_9STRA|nr:unnamed protein product [Phytophthora lilii]
MTCRGMNKLGKRCGTKYNLDEDGYCGWHSPKAVKCRGIAKYSGERCKISVGLNQCGYCKYHKNQDTDPGSVDAPYVSQCPGIASSTHCRCRKDWEICPNGYCIYHQKQAPWRSKPASQASRQYMENLRSRLIVQEERRAARRGFS